MKKIILGCLAFTASTLCAQKQKECYVSISAGADVRNAVMGSKPTNDKPALDYTINLHAVGNNFEMSPGYERFNEIGFSRYSCDFGYHINNWYVPLRSKELDLTLVPSVGVSMINRWGGEDHINSKGDIIYGESSHLAAQGSLSLRLKVSDRILLDWTAQGLTRPDLGYLYATDDPKSFVLSNYFKIHFLLN